MVRTEPSLLHSPPSRTGPPTGRSKPCSMVRAGGGPAERRLEELYRRHGCALFHYVLGRTFGDTHLAEDLVQETFLRAWRTPGVIDDRGETCRAWLVTVARNLVIDRLRGLGRRPRETSADPLPQIPARRCEIERVDMSLTLRKAMAALTPRRREILVRIYLQDQSLKEVSECLGVPVGTVKSRAHAALRALRSELADQACPPVPASAAA